MRLCETFSNTVCVLEHRFRLSERLDDVYDVCILFNVGCSVFIMCVVGFLIMASDDPTATVKYSLNLISSVVQIFLISLLGDMLIDSVSVVLNIGSEIQRNLSYSLIGQSTSVGNSAWQSEWFAGDRNYRKAIVMIIMRSQRPQQMTAFKFAVASMKLFSSVITIVCTMFWILTIILCFCLIEGDVDVVAFSRVSANHVLWLK